MFYGKWRSTTHRMYLFLFIGTFVYLHINFLYFSFTLLLLFWDIFTILKVTVQLNQYFYIPTINFSSVMVWNNMDRMQLFHSSYVLKRIVFRSIEWCIMWYSLNRPCVLRKSTVAEMQSNCVFTLNHLHQSALGDLSKYSLFFVVPFITLYMY